MCSQYRLFSPRSLMLLLVLFLVLAPVRCTMAQDSTSQFLGGVKLNNNRPYGLIGWIKSVSSRFELYTVADVGGNNAAFAELVHARIWQSNRWKLLLNFGPNLELITADPDFSNHSTYLSSAVGITITRKLSRAAYVHVGGLWLSPAHPPLPFKLFLGVSMPLQE